MQKHAKAALAAFFIASGCSTADSELASLIDERPTTTTSFIDQLDPSGAKTEGIVFSPDGRLFVSSLESLFEVQPDGTSKKILTFPHSIGLAWWQDNVVVASFGGSNSNQDEDGVIYLVNPDSGVTEVIPVPIPNPNFVVTTPWDTVIISDDIDQDSLWELRKSGSSYETTTWVTGIESPNGIAFSPNGATLYVVSTFVDPPPLWSVQIDGESAGEVAEVETYPGDTPDGITIDDSGKVYVGLNLPGELVEYDPTTDLSTVLVSDVFGIASMAIVPSVPAIEDKWGKNVMFATQLFDGGVWRIELGQPNP